MVPRTWPWCAGTPTASASGVMTLSAFFWASCSWRSEDLFGQSFSVIEPVQALRGLPCMGSFSVVRCIRCFEGPPGWGLLSGSAHQALKWAPWLESYSVVQCIRCLMGQLSIVRLPMLACWERGFGDGSTCYADSAVSSCFHGCPAFLHRHFPPPSPPSHHLSVSLKSAAALALRLFQYPLTPAPSCCTFQAACVPVWGTYGCGKDCLILILLRLPQISCFMLSLKCFSSDSDSCPNVIGPLLQFPHPLRAGPIY